MIRGKGVSNGIGFGNVVVLQNKERKIKKEIVEDSKNEMKKFTLKMGELTDDERTIILKGCLINYYRG